MKVDIRNVIGKSPFYAEILTAYNFWLSRDGKVNNKKFFEEVIQSKIPNYGMRSWYNFVKNYTTENGLQPSNQTIDTPPEEIHQEIQTTMLSNQEATARLIRSALNISANAAAKIAANPELLSNKEKLEIGIKAMKAQDSRIHAVGKLREDNREQERFDRAFSDASY